MAAPPPHTSLDPITVASAIAAALGISVPLASLIGPYAVIIVAAITGGATALSRRPETTRLGAGGFLARVGATATVLTAGAAELAVRYWPALDGMSHWLLAPIAFVIGLIGDDWRTVLRFAMAWRKPQ